MKLNIKTKIALLFLVYTSSLAFSQIKTEQFNGNDVVPNEILVKFNHSSHLSSNALRQAEDSSVADVVAKNNIDKSKLIGNIGVHKFHSRTETVSVLMQQIRSRADVEYAEPDYIVHTVRIPNDPDFSSLYGMQNISAPSAWDVTVGSANIVVGVVDSGIDYTHPDLAPNVWSAPTSFTVTIGGTPITCAAGTHGFNAILDSCDPFDDFDHGTHVSGTIGAAGNNGIGVVGVNWTTSIMAAKFIDASNNGSIADAIDAIEFIIQAKSIFGSSANVRVLSNSWGGGSFSQALLDEINRANANDLLFVAAAGNNASNNDATPFYPASYGTANEVSVAATDSADNLASFSNFGATSVQLGAPGVNILSTFPNASYALDSGTSMATPHVSGAAALLLSRCNLDTSHLKGTILQNVDPVSALAGLTSTGGKLNVNKALRSCLPPPVGTLTSYFDSLHNTLEVFYVGSDQHVHQVEWANDGTGWHTFDLNLLTGTANVATNGSMIGFVDTLISTKDAYYVGSDQHIHQLSWNSSTGWSAFDISSLAGATNVATGGRLIGFVDTILGSLQVFYVASDQHVHQLQWANNGTGWHTSDVNALTGGVNVASAGTMSGFDDTLLNCFEVFYIGTDQHVHQLQWANNGTGWHNNDVTAFTAATPVASGGNITSFLDKSVLNSLQIYYVASDFHVHQMQWSSSTGWGTADITTITGAPSAASGGSISSFVDATILHSLQVYYVASDQHVHQLQWSGSTGWGTADASAIAGAPNVITGGGLSTFEDGLVTTLDAYYIGADQHVHQLSWANNGTGWHTFDIGK